MAFQGGPQERNQDATVYVGDISERVDEALLWELMIQAGPVGISSSTKSDTASRMRSCVHG